MSIKFIGIMWKSADFVQDSVCICAVRLAAMQSCLSLTIDMHSCNKMHLVPLERAENSSGIPWRNWDYKYIYSLMKYIGNFPCVHCYAPLIWKTYAYLVSTCEWCFMWNIVVVFSWFIYRIPYFKLEYTGWTKGLR